MKKNNGSKAIDKNFTAPRQKLDALKQAIESKIIGQQQLIENIMVCLLADGHMLIEGMPRLAKTTAAKAMADGIDADFHRVQFTPDLLPSDLIGTEIYLHEKGVFTFRQGPIFNNILLADEINRAPAKVQSALLEAMGERQVTVGHKSYDLPEIYMVIATQNPVEQEGTYTLPEAQLDRFLMYVVVDYPSSDEELKIIELDEKRQNISGQDDPGKNSKTQGKASQGDVDYKSNAINMTNRQQLLSARSECSKIHVSDSLKNYVVSLVVATRTPKDYDAELAQWIMHGASPRATLALIRTAKALAWLRGDEYVTPYHIQTLCPYVLAHRIILSFEAEAKGVKRGDVIKRLLEVVAIP